MEETDVWATLTKQNSVIFHDNDVSLQKNDMLQILFSIQLIFLGSIKHIHAYLFK